MTKNEALEQLCKMQGLVAERLELYTICVCDEPQDKPKEGEVPDEVISEMWRSLSNTQTATERKQARNEMLADILSSAFAGRELATKTDLEVKEIVLNTVLADTPINSAEYDLLDTICMRLERSAGGSVPYPDGEDEKQ